MAKPTGNPTGRPLKYKTAKELQARIDEYFLMCEEKEEPLTIGELALYLDLSRQGLLEYSRKGAFSDTVKKAKQKVEVFIEKRLYSTAVTGPIFSLKNNFGWIDETKQDIKADLDVRMKDLGDYYQDIKK